jgi:hypothetical protein
MEWPRMCQPGYTSAGWGARRKEGFDVLVRALRQVTATTPTGRREDQPGAGAVVRICPRLQTTSPTAAQRVRLTDGTPPIPHCWSSNRGYTGRGLAGASRRARSSSVSAMTGPCSRMIASR